MFQLMFAIITPALISGAIADRAKFLGWAVFVTFWASLVYFPVAHWVFSFGDAQGNGAGWLAKLGVEDFAGGTAVHINAGAAGLALALVLGKRNGFGRRPGASRTTCRSSCSAPACCGSAGSASTPAPRSRRTAWRRWPSPTPRSRPRPPRSAGSSSSGCATGTPTTLGVASGAVAGLVAITPACAFLVPRSAILLGLVAGVVCAFAVGLKYRLGFDDSLDVVGVHLVGGIVGCLFLGFFGTTRANVDGTAAPRRRAVLRRRVPPARHPGARGRRGAPRTRSCFAFIIGYVINRTMGFRLDPEAEARASTSTSTSRPHTRP